MTLNFLISKTWMNHFSYRLSMLKFHIVQVQYFWFVLGSFSLSLPILRFRAFFCFYLTKQSAQWKHNHFMNQKTIFASLFQERIGFYFRKWFSHSHFSLFQIFTLSSVYVFLGPKMHTARCTVYLLYNSNKEWWNCVSETKNVFISAEVSLPLSRTKRVSTITYFLHAIFRFFVQFSFRW